MNKKGEFITFSIIMGIIIIIGLLGIGNKIIKSEVKFTYVGDSSTNIAYNLKSNNPNCNIDNIIIHKNNIMYFKDEGEIPEGFTIDENCN